jgi:predicted RNA binding protein YcfA (HicA-like mRNA interferase family)
VSSRLPVVKARDVERVARKLGFVLHHHTGSHAIYYREHDRRRATIPAHAGQELRPKTLRSIIASLGITVEEFRARL